MTDPAAPGDFDSRARAAITAARARAWRAWRNQLIGLLVVALLLGPAVWTVWQHSEIRAVRLHPTTQSPTALAAGDPPESLAAAWQTSERAATGEPVQQDVVATYSERTVNGRDAITGAVRWSYSRSDRKICDVVARNEIVIAIYEHDGLCDEVTGLDAGSGQRRWVRTLLSSGTPATLTVSSQDDNVLLVTPTATELIEPTGGLDWWYEDQPAGCTTRSAVLGSSGVLIASRCADGDKLSRRGLGGAKERAWTVPQQDRSPLSADALTTVLAADGRSIAVLNINSGVVSSTIRLETAVEAPAAPRAGSTDASGYRIEVVALARGSLALSRTTPPSLAWQRSSGGLPTDVSAGLLVAADGAVNLLNPRSGANAGTYRVVGLTADDNVDQLGRGFLVSNDAGTSAYR